MRRNDDCVDRACIWLYIPPDTLDVLACDRRQKGNHNAGAFSGRSFARSGRRRGNRRHGPQRRDGLRWGSSRQECVLRPAEGPVSHHSRAFRVRQDNPAAHDRRLPDADAAARSSSTAKPVRAVPPHKRSIGMVFQRLALFPHMTAAENVAFPLKMRRFDARTIPERVERYLDLVRLGGLRRAAHPRTLRRAAAARRDRPRAGVRAGPAASRRAAGCARPQAARGNAARVPPHPARARRHHDQRHPRPARGAGRVRRDHRHGSGRDPAEGTADPTPTAQPRNAFVAGFIGVTNFIAGTVRRRIGTGDRVDRSGRSDACRNGSAIRSIRLPRATRHRERSAPSRSVSPAMLRSCRRSIACWPGPSPTRSSKASAWSTRSPAPRLATRSIRVFDHDPAAHTQFDIGESVFLGWNARDMLVFR